VKSSHVQSVHKDPRASCDCFELSWRTAQLSDWKLHFGETVFNVHTAVLSDGPRRSELYGTLCESFDERKCGVWHVPS
jgi:hypothetical protein